MIRMPIGSGASRPHRTARDRRNGARNASESLPAIPRITHLSGRMPSDVALLRGAEGGYALWSKAHGGPYDGLLLSSGNSFPAQLAGILDDLHSGRVIQAERCSAAVSAASADAFAAVIEVRQGNAFTNANKALSQVMAYGDQALKAPPPRLYGGGHLPRSVLEAVKSSLAHHGLSPARGYFEHQFRSSP